METDAKVEGPERAKSEAKRAKREPKGTLWETMGRPGHLKSQKVAKANPFFDHVWFHAGAILVSFWGYVA